jgi:GNAT superfamily N-acetyltransferase
MDSVNIVKLIKAGWKETPASSVGEFNESAMLEYVNTTLRHAFAIVADLEGRLLGTIAVAPIRMPWYSKVILAESWFAVIPHDRAKKVPEQLLTELERFLDKQGLPALLGTQVLTPARLNAVFTPDRGYEPLRATFVRLPCSQVDTKGRPVMPPKAVSA